MLMLILKCYLVKVIYLRFTIKCNGVIRSSNTRRISTTKRTATALFGKLGRSSKSFHGLVTKGRLFKLCGSFESLYTQVKI